MHCTILFVCLSLGQGAPLFSQFYNATRKILNSSFYASPNNETVRLLSDPLQNITNNLNDLPMSTLMNKTSLNDSLISRKENNTRNRYPGFNDVIPFLKKFGYLDVNNLNGSESLIREDAVSEAIIQMQLFGGLYPTGKLDNETIKLLSTPRCGNKDIDGFVSRRKKRFIIGSQGWNKRRITYFLANWSPKTGNRETTLIELEKAFKMWSNYANLKFIEKQSPDADIVIMFGRGYHGDSYPFDGPGYTLAHAYFPYEYANFGGDIHFDEDESWAIGFPKEDAYSSEVNFFAVAAHEIGHSLGLSHSTVAGSIMFPYYLYMQPKVFLDYDDIVALHYLYISRYIQEEDSTNEEHTESSVITTTPTIAESTSQSDIDLDTTLMKTSTTQRSAIHEEEDSSERDVDDEEKRNSPTNSKPKVDERKKIEEEGLTPTVNTNVINYNGDWESVDEYRRRNLNLSTIEDDQQSKIPDICEGHFDAVSVLRNEIFFFKGQYVWRLYQRTRVDYGYPTHFRNLFSELPSSLGNIDALYERFDGNVVFFSGAHYWVFNGDHMIESSIPISRLGFPSDVQRLDAAVVWGKNKKTYFFSQNYYWRYNDVTKRMDNGYPQDITTRWRGVPSHLDAAMQWNDGNTYFFKKNSYWRFDDSTIRSENPLKAASFWLGCPE